jgi:hypothetical protein
LTWKDIEWLAGVTKLPVLVKGILRVDDALRAVNHGASGIIVSNHGARQLDTTPATISVLPEIVDAVAGAVEVYVDGGIRRGTDVVKAIRLWRAGGVCRAPDTLGTGGRWRSRGLITFWRCCATSSIWPWRCRAAQGSPPSPEILFVPSRAGIVSGACKRGLRWFCKGRVAKLSGTEFQSVPRSSDLTQRR